MAILRNDDWFDLAQIDDLDWDSPPCGEHCGCPLCEQADRDEAALYARLRDADARGSLDLGALAVLASKPWREGEAA